MSDSYFNARNLLQVMQFLALVGFYIYTVMPMWCFLGEEPKDLFEALVVLAIRVLGFVGISLFYRRIFFS